MPLCLVTGASSGIGKAAALELARRGFAVALLCRDRARGEAVLREVGERGELYVGDLSSHSDIRRVAAEFRARHRHLDVLLNNAGLYRPKRTVTAGGLEMTFAVNHLAVHLLTSLLLEPLKAAPRGRVVTVSSEAHRIARLSLDDPQMTHGYNGYRAYANSKLSNLLFTYELARRLEGTGVTANACHPGVVATGIVREMSAAIRAPWATFAKSPARGAKTPVYLCTAEVAVSGRYFIDQREADSSPESHDVETARRLWELSDRLAGL